MRIVFIVGLCSLFHPTSMAQNPLFEESSPTQVKRWRQELPMLSNDTLRMAVLRSLAFYYIEINRDSALYFGDQQLAAAKELKLSLWEADAYEQIGYAHLSLGDYTKSLQSLLAGIKIAENEKSERNIWHISRFSKARDARHARLNVLANLYNDMGELYSATQNNEKRLFYYKATENLARTLNDATILSLVCGNLSTYYYELNKLDSALLFNRRALNYSSQAGFEKYNGYYLLGIGLIYSKKESWDSARNFFALSIRTSLEKNNQYDLGQAYIALSALLRTTEQYDSSLMYAKRALATYQKIGSPLGTLNAHISLASSFELTNETDSALVYQKRAMVAKEGLISAEKIRQFQNMGFDELLKVQELEKEKMESQNKVRTGSLAAGIGVFILITFMLVRNNRSRQKANAMLLKQKGEIELQKENLEEALTDLKATQSQLIQSEKMASLGELTAGIAHEIQNPLNFVNNFSELNEELIAEMKDELREGKIDGALALADSVLENQKKINQHGKRADGIVKGMLQHSRSSSGVKEPTNINVLADEYLRLAYHGFRAKDKSFNAKFTTDFDPTIQAINVVPQEIGRVILNLINNAFYAVNEKSTFAEATADKGYEPSVTVSTKNSGTSILISVKDNGNGIPDSIKERIFQPFFTTKPTGQGTGLGLSLAYDIVTKGNGGELNVTTQEGRGSEFIITLPS